jgi:uncharacterized protein
MIKELNLNLNPASASNEAEIRKIAATLAHIPQTEINTLRIIRKSVDARNAGIRVNMTVQIFCGEDDVPQDLPPYLPQDVRKSKEVIIIGAGPAGLFAALRLIERGIRPVILERGRDVSARKRDIALISREHKVDPDSNFCFGEGGAGTYSDGKLYTRSKKRGDNLRVLELLCLHGANRNILYEAHPHLGTDKLPGIIAGLRKSILEAGGEFLMEKRVDDILISGDEIIGVRTVDGVTYHSPYVILATGHSARDIYELCLKKGIELTMKSFAMGVRVEHPQALIDKIQYHGKQRGDYLPAAAYSLVKQIDDRGVYSFCMCPGGFIVPSATSQEEVVVNGMSPSERNSPYANAGIVVEIRPEDLSKYSKHRELAGIMFQQELEHAAWANGGETQRAPAQRLSDFVAGRSSGSLPKVSYFPGVTSSPLHEWLPSSIGKRLKEGFVQFGQIMRGYLTNDAVILGVESRTSSPVRIPRDPEKLHHIKFTGLYPCGEGAGYSGGIVSSAVDGMNIAEAIAASINSTTGT